MENKLELLEALNVKQLLAGLANIEVKPEKSTRPELLALWQTIPFLPVLATEEYIAENKLEGVVVGDVLTHPLEGSDVWLAERAERRSQEKLMAEEEAKKKAEEEAAKKEAEEKAAKGTMMLLNVRMDGKVYEKGKQYNLSTEEEGKLRGINAIA